MSLLPLLLRPKALAVKNYFQRRQAERSQSIRDAVIILFGFSVMAGIFYGGVWMTEKLQAERAFVYFPPSVPLGLMLVYLFLMLILSNSATAIASLYLSHDLDLVLSTPFPPAKFFFGKLLDILLSSSWITMVFVLPAIFSFARYYHAPWHYYFISLTVLLPYFLIPTALSIIGVTAYSRLVSASRTKELLMLVSAIGVMASYIIFQLIFPEPNAFTFRKLEDVLRIVAVLSVPNADWSPSYWASTCLSELLIPSKASIVPHFVLLYSTAVGLIALAFLCVRYWHFEAYSRAGSGTKRTGFGGFDGRQAVNRLLPFVSRHVRAQFIKEMKLFTRDLTQIFQLLLLSGICLLYFYNFRIIHGIQNEIPEQSRAWWDVFVFVVNTYIEAFLVTAVGTRFVFQSVSLEGRSFWIILTSPVSLRSFLRTKFIFWLVPVALILGFVFAAGAYAVGTPLHLILLKTASTWVICFGIVGLGVGLGAYYSNFTWEHPTQLAASFGSLVYMLACVALVSVDMAILGLVLVFRNLYGMSESFTYQEYVAGVFAAVFLFIYLNFAATRWALAAGEAELERRMR